MINKNPMRFSCAILAGGSSKRMGTDKATLTFRKRMLISHVYEIAKKVFDEILIVTNNHRLFPGMRARIVKDIVGYRTPIAGIVTSLLRSSSYYTFVVACDMPFVTERGFKAILENHNGEDIVVPKTEKGFEPLHAIYSRKCIPFFLRFLSMGCFKIQCIFPYVEVSFIEDGPHFLNGEVKVFTNINTKEDLKRFSGWDPKKRMKGI